MYLEVLDIKAIYLQSLEPLKQCKHLQKLTINAPDFVSLQGIEALTNLKSLHLLNARLTSIYPIRGLRYLEEIKLDGLAHLVNLNGLQHCKNLKKVRVDTPLVRALAAFHDLNELEELNIVNIATHSLELMGSLPKLQSLHLCKSVKKLEGLSKYSSLRSLTAWTSSQIRALPNLEVLVLNGKRPSDHVEMDLYLRNLRNLPRLKELILKSTHLTTAGLGQLQSLEKLTLIDSKVRLLIHDCASYERMLWFPKIARNASPIALAKIKLKNSHLLIAEEPPSRCKIVHDSTSRVKPFHQREDERKKRKLSDRVERHRLTQMIMPI